MAVYIGHACIDERGRAKGGAAGDQTLKEVYKRTWYSKPWHTVFRAKSPEIAEKIAKAMEQACANNNIGYDQYQRTTLYTLAKAKGWDISKVTTKCETDCSALVAVCCNAAGIAVSKDMYTGNESAILKGTGKFNSYIDSLYTRSSSYLRRGDILLGNGHTAIVLSNGDKVKAVANNTTTTAKKPTAAKTTQKIATGTAQKLSKPLAGTYKVTAVSLNVRNNAGTKAASMVAIPKDTEVKNFGYYSEDNGTKWLYIQFKYKDVLYTGFASSKRLKKIG
jgi:hypothetical protein